MNKIYSNENGGLLVVLLIIFVLLIGIITTLAAFLYAQNRALENSEAAMKAFYYAQSGVDKCLTSPDIRAIDTTAIGEGKFLVKVQTLSSGEKYWIRSTGLCKQKMRTLSVLIEKKKGSKFKILDWQDSYLKQVTN